MASYGHAVKGNRTKKYRAPLEAPLGPDAHEHVQRERAEPTCHRAFRAAVGFLSVDFSERRSRLPRAISVSSASNSLPEGAELIEP
jgi:hypothetical protein